MHNFCSILYRYEEHYPFLYETLEMVKIVRFHISHWSPAALSEDSVWELPCHKFLSGVCIIYVAASVNIEIMLWKLKICKVKEYLLCISSKQLLCLSYATYLCQVKPESSNLWLVNLWRGKFSLASGIHCFPTSSYFFFASQRPYSYLTA